MEFILENWPAHRPPLQGASVEDIARLESAQARPLPATYVALLKRVGHGTHGLKWVHADFRVDSILQFLASGAKMRLVPKRYLLVARDSTESNLDFLLDLEQAPGAEPTVVRGSVITQTKEMAPEHVFPDANSLAEMLFRAAFLILRKETLPHSSLHASIDFTGTPEERQRVETVLAELGLTRHPLSGPWFQAYESKEGLVAARWLKGRVLQLLTASEDEDWVVKTDGELESRLPVKLI